MKPDVSVFLDRLVRNYPSLDKSLESIVSAFNMIAASYRKGGKLLACGNGGSAADTEHIVGELMKTYMLKRPVSEEIKRKILEQDPATGNDICSKLQCALPAISLVSQTSLCTAIANDVDANFIFAQQVFGYGRQGDTLLTISTSGQARNCINAVYVAKALGVGTVVLTGSQGGRLKEISDVAVCAPACETWRVQEFHQPIYHALCGMLEAEFFS